MSLLRCLARPALRAVERAPATRVLAAKRGYMQLLAAGYNPFPSSKNRPVFHNVTHARQKQRSQSPFPPMTELWPGAPDPAVVDAPKDYKLKTSRLANGILVSSRELHGVSGTVSIGIKAGTVHEKESEFGANMFLERCLFSDVKTRSGMSMTNFCENTATLLQVLPSMYNLVVQADFLRQDFEEVMHLLGAAVHTKSFSDAEVESTKAIFEQQRQFLHSDGENFMVHAAEHLAFAGSPLANGYHRFLAQGGFESMSAGVLASYWNAHRRCGNLVISGVGVDHDELVRLSGEIFGDLTDPSSTSDPAVAYNVEQEDVVTFELPREGNLVDIFLGFQGVGFLDPDMYPALIVQSLMGGGHSFSAGGPGKGMYTRLYSRALARYPWIKTAIFNTRMYPTTGFVGMFGSCEREGASSLVEVLAYEIGEVLNDLTEKEVDRARNMFIGRVLTELESRMNIASDISLQNLIYGKYYTPQEVIEKFRSVTLEDVQRVVRRMLASKPVYCMAAGPDAVSANPSDDGTVRGVPHLADVQYYFAGLLEKKEVPQE